MSHESYYSDTRHCLLLSSTKVKIGCVKNCRLLTFSLFVLTGSNRDLLKTFLRKNKAGTDKYAGTHCQAETDVEIRSRTGFSLRFSSVLFIHGHCKYAAQCANRQYAGLQSTVRTISVKLHENKQNISKTHPPQHFRKCPSRALNK